MIGGATIDKSGFMMVDIAKGNGNWSKNQQAGAQAEWGHTYRTVNEYLRRWNNAEKWSTRIYQGINRSWKMVVGPANH